MKITATLLFALFLCSCQDKPIHASWTGKAFVCPADTSEWADQSEAPAGHDDYVYCIEDAR